MPKPAPKPQRRRPRPRPAHLLEGQEMPRPGRPQPLTCAEVPAEFIAGIRSLAIAHGRSVPDLLRAALHSFTGFGHGGGQALLSVGAPMPTSRMLSWGSIDENAIVYPWATPRRRDVLELNGGDEDRLVRVLILSLPTLPDPHGLV